METYGNAYEVVSPRAPELDKIVYDTCKTHDILCGVGEVFAYLRELPPKHVQLSML